MTVRITKKVESGIVVLHVDGRLRSEHVCELKSEYRGLTGPVALDLSQLRSADAAGVAAILEIESHGADLRGVSGYVELVLSQSSRTTGSRNGST